MAWQPKVLQTVTDFWRVKAGDFATEQEAIEAAEENERPRFRRVPVSIHAFVDDVTGHTHVADLDEAGNPVEPDFDAPADERAPGPKQPWQ
jgi:hypothetical protein